jgi:3'5'-cyclic nucleotide phosphodiesterase
MESNGERNKIQVSQKTADLIKLSGKGFVSCQLPIHAGKRADNSLLFVHVFHVFSAWLVPREEKVSCKGKGMMTTFWCDPCCTSESFVNSDGSVSKADDEARLERLIDWNVDLFTHLVLDVVNCRGSLPYAQVDSFEPLAVPGQVGTGTPRDEVLEVIDFAQLPNATHELFTNEARLKPPVLEQLREFIAQIAGLYKQNPFHNFEHCGQVTMSTHNLLKQVAQCDDDDDCDDGVPSHGPYYNEYCSSDIALGPLARLAIVFSALIHGVDHPGVSNAQLVQEGDILALKYHDRNVAEQNSIVVAWDLWMDPRFADLRDCIFATDAELKLFRQIVVNSVLAADLFDVELRTMHETRWIMSFGRAPAPMDDTSWSTEEINRRATVVLDLIVQASSVSHAMQHFTIYKKWNLRLLDETYAAYHVGRTAIDPLMVWYEGELSFFDDYVIPLVLKLQECNVFGTSCNKLLDFAQDNRMEWAEKGREIVREAVELLSLSKVAREL